MLSDESVRTLQALSSTEQVARWMNSARHPRVLHVFDDACNLISEHGEVISIVTQKISKGPFNLVLQDPVDFTEYINATSSVIPQRSHLRLGALTIHAADTEFWSPKPHWESLHARRADVLNSILHLPGMNYKPSLPRHLLSALSTSLAAADISNCIPQSRRLTGLGMGLTPAGDDFIMGALYAAWIIHPIEIAQPLATKIADTAAPLTTSLSAAWLRAAGRGEAGITWHELFDAFATSDSSQIQNQIQKILAVGATSGADAFAGFVDTFLSYAEPEKKHVLPTFIR
jgi:hypothetical protein